MLGAAQAQGGRLVWLPVTDEDAWVYLFKNGGTDVERLDPSYVRARKLNQYFTQPDEAQRLVNLALREHQKTGEDLINTGGRVFGITTSGNSIKKARKKNFESMKAVNFNGIHWRDDIGLFN